MAETIQRGDLATVFGGTGFVGRYTVRALARRGVRIRAAVRRPDLAGHLQPMGAVGQIHAVQANLRYSDSVQAAVAGADYVVNLVAVLASTGKQTFDALHVEGARAVARAAREAGVRNFVHVSALGADPRSASEYAQSKALGEQAVREEFPDAVILRPSIVFGPEDQFFNRFAKLAQSIPFLPLIGDGKTRFQPIYVMDLADALVAALGAKAEPGATYEIGGPEILSLRDVLDRVQIWSGRDRPYVRLPFALAKLMAILTWPLPNAVRPLTLDQVRLLQSDNIVSPQAHAEGRTLADLGNPTPQSTGNIVPIYLERFRPRGQFSHYRS